METKSYSIFNKIEYGNTLSGLSVPQFTKSNLPCLYVPQAIPQPKSNDQSVNPAEVLISNRKFCSFCNIGFENQVYQRQHYKLDWHRYNLKQNLKQRKPITEEQFSQMTDDVSSISGSESENESETDLSSANETDSEARSAHLIHGRTRLLFQNHAGNIVSIFRCLFPSDKEDTVTESQLTNVAECLPDSLSNSQWLIVMIGGGHFAAAVFKGIEPILHKTFHCYTVRAKQGGAQSSKDNKRATASKSAGASLRRYNEASLLQHVQDILTSWSKEIGECSLLFYRAVGPGNRSIFFGGRQPPLDKSDHRLRTIPFPTRRATFSEIKRVHSLLCSMIVYDSEEAFANLFSLKPAKRDESDSTPEKKSKGNKGGIDRAKERPTPDRPLPDIVMQLTIQTSESDSEDEEWEQKDQEVSFKDSLQGFGHDTPVLDDAENQKRKKPKRKKKKAKKDEEETVGSWALSKRIFMACTSGDVAALTKAFQERGEDITSGAVYSALNQTTPDGITLLMQAAKDSQKDVVRFLLENGGDPCVKEKKSMTAYDFAPDKETRNVFRRFMGEFPDKYDYSKSHIPSPLTDTIEKEILEKKKAMKKIKRQKEKERKIADAPRKHEEKEKERFLNLSDREKRALAAERRILASVGKAGDNLVLIRCYKCAENITGKVPFEYENFVFCSMDCLKAHRIMMKTSVL